MTGPRLSRFEVAGRGRPALHQETALIGCRLCAAIFTSVDNSRHLNLSCLAESAANLRTSWAALVRWELASKLHLKHRSVSPQWRQYATLFGSDGGSFVGSSGFTPLYHINFRLPLFAMGIAYGICVLLGGLLIRLAEKRLSPPLKSAE